MGRIVFLSLLVIVFSSSLAFAGETYDVDFSELRTQSVYVHNDDQIRFHLLGDEHVIIIEDVGLSSIKVDIGLFLSNNTKLTPGLIGLDYLMRLDLDKDGVTDLNVALYSVSEDGIVHLVLQDVTQSDLEEETNTGVVEEKGLSSTKILILLGIIILALVLFLLFRKSLWSDEGKKGEVLQDHTEAEHFEDKEV